MRLNLTILMSLLSAALPAQAEGRDQESVILDLAKQRALFAATGDALDVRWAFDADQGLLVRPNPSMGGARRLEFTPYLKDPSIASALGMYLSHMGPSGQGALLLFGNQDLASSCFADYHFRRMGLDRTPAGLQRRIAKAKAPAGRDQRLHEIHRLLAVRIVQRRKIEAAVPQLRALIKERGVNRMLRWAAEDALAILVQEPVQKQQRLTRFPSLEETLAAVPDEFDGILTIDYTLVPPSREISWFLRRAKIETGLMEMEAAVGVIPESTFADLQLRADLSSITAFRLAYHLGNLQVSRLTATVGARRGQGTADVWVRCDGDFDAARILAVLGDNGWEVQGEIASSPGVGGDIRVTRRFVEFRSEGHEQQKTGGRAAALKAAGFGGGHVVFAQTGKLRRLSALLGAPLAAFDNGVLVGSLTGDRKFDARIRFPERAAANALMNLIQLGLQAVRVEFGEEARFTESDPAELERVFFPRFELDEGKPEIRVQWDDTGLTFESALRTMKLPVGPSRQDGPKR